MEEDMKKIIAVLLLVSVLLLVGCKKTDEGVENDEKVYLSLGENVSTVTVLKGGDYLPYQITGEDVGVLLSELGEIAYTEGAELTAGDVELPDVKYTVRGSGILILVCENDFVICRQDEGNIRCEISEGDFSFLDGYDYRPTPKKLSSLVGFDESISSLLFHDVQKNLTLDLSNNTKLYTLLLTVEGDVVTPDAETEVKYTITLSDKVLSVNADGSVSYTTAEGEAARMMPTGDALSYLDTVTEGEVMPLGGFDAEAEIKAYNSQKLVCEITEKEDFLARLGEIKLIKLTKKSHYTLGDYEFVIVIGNDVIKLYGDFVTVGGDAYYITEGDYEFLSELSYSASSDGYLPWI